MESFMKDPSEEERDSVGGRGLEHRCVRGRHKSSSRKGPGLRLPQGAGESGIERKPGSCLVISFCS